MVRQWCKHYGRPLQKHTPSMNRTFTTKAIKVAVLITCHNRYITTLKCLNRLFHQVKPDNIDFTVYLVDASSKDATVDLVEKFFPSVNIIKGGEQLYWSSGMRLAFQEAKKKPMTSILT